MKEDTFFEDWQALIEDFETFTKSEANPFFKSKYVPLKAILPVVKEKCHKHNFIFIQFPTVNETRNFLRTEIRHRSGKNVIGEIELVAKENDPQKLGASITYMRRYSLTCMFGLEEDDDDGNYASTVSGKLATKQPADVQQELAMKGELLCLDCATQAKISKTGNVYCPQSYKDKTRPHDKFISKMEMSEAQGGKEQGGHVEEDKPF